MKLHHILKAKKGSVTMMSVGMLPVFLLLAGTIVLLSIFWTSYTRLVTAADAGAIVATQYMKNKEISLEDEKVMLSTSFSSVSQDSTEQKVAKKVQHIVMKNGGGAHGEILCKEGKIMIVASSKVLNRWTIHAKGYGTQETITCNWRKILY
jgi:hypothetical protein